MLDNRPVCCKQSNDMYLTGCHTHGYCSRHVVPYRLSHARLLFTVRSTLQAVTRTATVHGTQYAA
jgi:hypothetical protein